MRRRKTRRGKASREWPIHFSVDEKQCCYKQGGWRNPGEGLANDAFGKRCCSFKTWGYPHGSEARSVEQQRQRQLYGRCLHHTGILSVWESFQLNQRLWTTVCGQREPTKTTFQQSAVAHPPNPSPSLSLSLQQRFTADADPLTVDLVPPPPLYICRPSLAVTWPEQGDTGIHLCSRCSQLGTPRAYWQHTAQYSLTRGTLYSATQRTACHHTAIKW